MHWTIPDLLGLPTSYYAALVHMLEEDAAESEREK